jgi:hypothetical protein
MKTIAVMQPYLFPYIGYFQLMHAVDEFVFFDNVNFVNKGWINRNRILLQGKEHLFSLPLTKASQNRNINEIAVSVDDKWRAKFMRSIEAGYKKAPQFERVNPLLEKILNKKSENLADFIARSFEQINAYLGLRTPLVNASRQYPSTSLKGPDRIIEICNLAEANVYVNAIGGRELYSKERFLDSGVQLRFISTLPWKYGQQGADFVPNLSIIDVLMNSSPLEVQEGLLSYELI